MVGFLVCPVHTKTPQMRGVKVDEPDLEGAVLREVETGLLQLHERSSSLSGLVDTPELTFDHAAVASRELIVDVGEISRHNMLLVEEMIAAVRTLQRAHARRVIPRPKASQRYRVTLPQLLVLGIAALVGIGFAAFLIGYVQGFPEGCARGIREVLAHRAV
ncbi:hypothetical protein [Sphingomonas sp. BK481]|uniref:hypothetical protein n=1 Tax=Sphingomonas sp. BK481 TaxID=2586981 RepID=UPI0017BD1279|nr:hypothetical protein [Sphingomonas sp. BK481]MBB3588992.1 hypothetical protein [Sphingomonas sp. BK481]